jgi:hypothetical protein
MGILACDVQVKYFDGRRSRPVVDFLKGNYALPDKTRVTRTNSRGRKSLTEQFEEATLAKLGGSLCFVAKGKTFLWTGEGNEKASP